MADGAEILQLIDRFDRASDGLESDAIARIHGIFDASFRALERELRTEYPRLTAIGGLVAAQQKTLILDRMGGLLQLLNPNQAADYDRLFQELLTLSNETGGELAGQLIQAYEDESLEPFTGIPVEAVVNQATEGRRRLYRYSEDFQDKANTIIGMGLSQGWGVRRVESALRSELGVAKGKAETLARTEVMSALNQSAAARYKENGIDFVLWNISPSEGLCVYCADRNQKVFEIDKIVYPLHPRDRCFLSPYRPEWQEKGLFDDKFAAEYRQQGIDELAKRGLTPNSGLAPFEKAAKLDKPPTAIWQPGDPPAKAHPKATKPTLKAREVNPDAIPDLSARDFRRYLANKEDIATQNDPGQAWNQSFAEYKAATGRNKSAYQADVIDAVRDGFIPSSNTLADLKLNKTLNAQIQQNRQSAEERERFQGLIQKAVDQPLLTNRDAAGYKPRMTREEAARYTDGSYFGSTEFFHGNGKTVTDSVANDGAQPERNRRGLYGMGFYMGVDRSIGEHYARYAHGNDIGIVTAVTKVQNPYVSTVSEMARLGQNFEGDQSNGIDAVAVHQFLRAKGYDSIYLKDSGYSIAFDQRQVVIVEYEDVSDRRDELADYQTDTEERENVARNPNGARFLQIDNSEVINYTEQWSEEEDF
ncbi:MAG: hypothetical protein AAF215_05250 [Cyanobacteria bacterium P01_A01_bin.123]